MNIWPSITQFPMPVINTFSDVSLGVLKAIRKIGLEDAVSTTWPSANLAIYIPFYLSLPILVKQLFVENGVAVSGNIDMAIYSADAVTLNPSVKLTSAVNGAQVGISAHQIFNITDVLLGPGLFYFAVVLDNTTGALQAIAVGSLVVAATFGVCEEASAYPLPAVATPVVFATADYLPLVALAQQAVI